MKIKILRHYHGVLNNDQHFNVGETYDVEDEAAKELVKRGYAEAVAAEKLATKRRGNN